MPGDRWQRLANLRLLYTYHVDLPRQEAVVHGQRVRARTTEWNFREALPWQLALQHDHAGLQRLIGDLNRLYVGDERLHAREFEPAGFRWLSCGDHLQSVLVFERVADERQPGLIVALNFTPVPRHDYRFGVPSGRAYREIFNSDAERYGGSNTGNLGLVKVLNEPSLGLPCSVNLTLPPLGAVILAPER
jgi:1,4-alpha-glucan branching enzyme